MYESAELVDIENVGIAHQKLVRDEMQEKESSGDRWWESIDLSLAKAEVRQIELSEAKKLIEVYEWLHCMPAISLYAYGIFFDGHIGGCVVFSTEYSENLGVWDKYDFTGKMLLLSRGVCVHWTPKNSNSKLIMSAIKLLPEKYKVITATIDRLAGEIGTIYQACNFVYVGRMKKAKYKDAWLIDGKKYGSRSMRMLVGTQRMADILERFPTAKKIKDLPKERYFLFRGSKTEIKYYRSNIEDKIKPYPKRSSGETDEKSTT